MFLEQSTDKNNCSIEKGRNAHNKKKQVVYWSEGVRTVRNKKVFVSKQVQVKQEDVASTTAEKENNVNTVSNEQATQPQQIRKRKKQIQWRK